MRAFENGITNTANTVRLGSARMQHTAIMHGNNTLTFNLNGPMNHRIAGAGLTVFNEQVADNNFRIEGLNSTILFLGYAGNDLIGIPEIFPTATLHIKQLDAGGEGRWTRRHSTQLCGGVQRSKNEAGRSSLRKKNKGRQACPGRDPGIPARSRR